MLVIGCIKAKICKKISVGIRSCLKRRLRKKWTGKKKISFENGAKECIV